MFRFNQVSAFQFCNQQQPPQADDYLFITDRNNQIFLLNNAIPQIKDIKLSLNTTPILIGHIKNQACFCLEMNKTNDYNNLHGYSIRTSSNALTLELFQAALLANHINYWQSNNMFCGKCGNQTILLSHEWALQCKSCNHITYTHISPCVIGIISRDDKILLAKNKNANNNVYSCIAGFVNPGENLETALAREAMEEVGIKIKNIQYIASQQWPFPSSLMMGFTAEYESGEITIDYNELSDAKWFTKDELSRINLPNEISIAYHLINLAVTTIKSNKLNS